MNEFQLYNYYTEGLEKMLKIAMKRIIAKAEELLEQATFSTYKYGRSD